MDISSERTAFKFSICSFFRIGSIILALHDASDVFMEAAKVFKYSEKELAASVFFGFFAISWFILRLIFFPFWVIKATRFALLVNDFISPYLALVVHLLICFYYWHFPALIFLDAWIHQRRMIDSFTIFSIHCWWCYLCFTYTGGYLYAQWSRDNWKIEEKLEKI